MPPTCTSAPAGVNADFTPGFAASFFIGSTASNAWASVPFDPSSHLPAQARPDPYKYLHFDRIDAKIALDVQKIGSDDQPLTGWSDLTTFGYVPQSEKLKDRLTDVYMMQWTARVYAPCDGNYIFCTPDPGSDGVCVCVFP